jgi:hypothetical protein
MVLAPLMITRAQDAPELPAAPIQLKVRTACLRCHDSGIIVQQRLDKKTWGKEVDKMIRWGALVQQEERDAFVDYLSSNFPADKPPAAPKYAPAQPKPAK